MEIKELYKLMNGEFMGHKIDGVIMAKPFEDSQFGKDQRREAELKLAWEVHNFNG